MYSKYAGKLKFINHACFYLQSARSILICDPWLEGLAFNNGWSLLDKASSNQEIIKDLICSKKKIFIWYSHEHSDHFSISFLKELSKSTIPYTIIFQNTLDKRIIRYLKSKNISTIEASNGNEIVLDKQLSFYVWSHKNGDSFSLLSYKNINILNLNDCIINNKREVIRICASIKNITSKIDFLFTQFGYANWIGNKENQDLRIKAAYEKKYRILLQHDFFLPEIIIPFASFISFCNIENFYLNKEQNTPKSIKNSSLLKSIKNKLIFLKPQDEINLNKYKEKSEDLEKLSVKAIEHWGKLFRFSKPIISNTKVIEFHTLKKESKNFLDSINKSFIFLPALLEFFKLIKPISIYVKDLDKQLYFSYFNNKKKANAWDIKIKSEDLFHSLKYEYGFNTLRVNGKFEVSNMRSYKNFIYFFFFQDLVKENITIRKPINLLKKTFELSIVFIKNTLSFRI